MSIRGEIIEFICILITFLLLFPIFFLLTPYLPEFEDYITGSLIIPSICTLGIGVYIILEMIILRILKDKNKSK